MNLRRVFKIVTIILWLVMVGLFIHKVYLKPHGERVSPAEVRDQNTNEEEWMGIYCQGEKIGYAVNSMKRAGDTYEILDDSLMYFTMLGTKQRIATRIKSVVAADHTLTSFEFSLSADQINFFLRGEVDGLTLKLFMVSGGSESRSQLQLKEVPFLASTLKSYFSTQTLATGEKFRLPFFDPSTLSSSEITIEVLEKEMMQFSGEASEVYKVKQSFQGIETFAYVSESGETLKEEGPMGLTLIKESRAEALSGEWVKKENPDLIALTTIAVDTLIEDPRNTTFLKIRLKDIVLSGFNLDGGRQTVIDDIVEIRTEDLSVEEKILLPFSDPAFEPYLQPTPFIQSDDARINGRAREIIRGTRDAQSATKALLSWVYKNLKKEPLPSIPNALDVLERKRGDCNEHTALFTALCRAVGIPARICVGIVYTNDQFYYHAWSEIFLGHWVAVDPTFNQFPADATHIRLLIGDLSDQVKVLSVVGRLHLEVLDYS